ncbi:hypothetical protein GR28A_00081 [Vibrio phage vB_VcorM_GR28A]|nr:hypothetical protein GR28A_00081 [Vibrio phage vB_VcorM_GR28A]
MKTLLAFLLLIIVILSGDFSVTPTAFGVVHTIGFDTFSLNYAVGTVGTVDTLYIKMSW